VAAELARTVSPSTIDGIWLFPPLRHEDRESGTAVVSCRIGGERRRLYTASYLVVVRGRERGQGRAVVEAVGDTPDVVVRDVIAGVQRRSGDASPPLELSPHAWFGPSDDGGGPPSVPAEHSATIPEREAPHRD
jgi:hypothetical protein